MKINQIFLKELRINRTWHICWLSIITSLFALIVGIYPGSNTENNLLPLFNQNYFQILFGTLSPINQGYILWISIFLPFIILIIFLYSIMNVTRIVNLSISDNSGEILFVSPISRKEFLLTKWLANLTPFTLLFSFQLLILSFPVFSDSVILIRLAIISFWGFLFCLSGISLGLIIGLNSKSLTKGYQISILLILVIYLFQVLARFNHEFIFLTDLNPLSYYHPDIYLIYNRFSNSGLYLNIFQRSISLIPILLIIFPIFFLIIGFTAFERIDLADDTNMFGIFSQGKFHSQLKVKFLNNIKIFTIFIYDLRIFYYSIKSVKTKVASFFVPKHRRNNPLVIWARIFEKRMPITADFIYSDTIVLFISILTIILFFPIQIGFYPGNNTVNSSLSILYGSGIFLVFSYGHILPSDPYLWYLMVNSIGRVWIILLPLSFFWAKKAILNDSDSKTGEILGSLPIEKNSVVFQRFIAIFSELLLLLTIMIFALILGEFFSDNSYNQLWEGISLFLLLKKKGILLSGLFLGEVILSFILSIFNPNFNAWYFKGLFGLDDPVSIILEHSSLTNIFGFILLTGILILSVLILILLASRFTFSNSDENQSKKSSN